MSETIFSPATEADVATAVQQSCAQKQMLRIVGGGTKQEIGRPIKGINLSLKKLVGITLYEPAEMVIGARAGTSLKEIEETLAAKGQMLPFEPVDYRALLGTRGEPTIGAVAAMNNSGSRRISAGAARDSLIGVRFINGQGETVKNGGRVMKNVTGLDLTKLQAGAWGTLGVLSEVIFKVLPIAETQATLVLHGLDDTRGVAALCAALNTPFDITAAAHLPALDIKQSRTLLRLEGFEISLKYRMGELTRRLADFGAATVAAAETSAHLWQDIRKLTPILTPAENAVWRLSVKPTDGPRIVAAIARTLPVTAHFYDWSGGQIWLSVAGNDLGAGGAIRNAVTQYGGHATLIRGTETLRNAVAPFQPEAEALAKLSLGLRRSVDPHGIFNTGLMG